jgi:hypothetical protein
MPVSPGATFPIPDVRNIPLVNVPVMTVFIFGTLNVSLGAGPDFKLSSINITADWNVSSSSNASARGTVKFSNASTSVKFNSIQVYDGLPYDVTVE